MEGGTKPVAVSNDTDMESQEVNIFCPEVSDQFIHHCLQDILPEKCRMTTDGSHSNWQKLTIFCLNSRLEFIPFRYAYPGDEFSEMALSGIEFFSDIRTDAIENREFIVSFLSERCSLSIGVVASPKLSQQDGHLDYVFWLADRCNGLVFNGFSIFNPSGQILLSADGSYDGDVVVG